MIVIIHNTGTSFKGLGNYLTHDPGASSDERVGWTHTENLANDDPRSATDEMLWTARNAELLKQEAGIPAGGRETEKPVKHFSLNWSPDEDPSRAHMIETTENFLRHMNWDEHQALLVAHEDKSHSHVHVMLNAVHPETGLKLDEGFEQRRAQTWALGYELEQENVRCANRLENAENREASPTRPMWTAFQKSEKEFEQQEKSRLVASDKIDRDPENPENTKTREWQALKEMQRDQRVGFFAEGKSAFSELRRSIYQDVREEFRPKWADYFEAVKSGGNSDELEAYKAGLIAEQRGALDTRRDAACAELRGVRDTAYQEILGEQREMRAGLTWRQDAGLDCSQFLRSAQDGTFNKSAELPTSLRDGASEAGAAPAGSREDRDASAPGPDVGSARNGSGMRSGTDVGLDIGFGAIFGVASIADSIADGVVGGKRAPRNRAPGPERAGPSAFEVAAQQTSRQSEEKREKDDGDWRKRQQERYWE